MSFPLFSQAGGSCPVSSSPSQSWHGGNPLAPLLQWTTAPLPGANPPVFLEAGAMGGTSPMDPTGGATTDPLDLHPASQVRTTRRWCTNMVNTHLLISK